MEDLRQRIEQGSSVRHQAKPLAPSWYLNLSHRKKIQLTLQDQFAHFSVFSRHTLYSTPRRRRNSLCKRRKKPILGFDTPARKKVRPKNKKNGDRAPVQLIAPRTATAGGYSGGCGGRKRG